MVKLSILLLWSIPCLSADLTGRWAGKLSAGGQQFPLHIEMKQSGDEVTGAFGYRNDFLWPLSNVRMEGARLSFVMQLPAGPASTFEGLVEGDAVTGKLASTAKGLQGAFEMKKSGSLSRLPATLVPRCQAGLEKLSDEFSNPESLREWKTLSGAEQLPDRIEQMDIGRTSPGHLSIIPKSAAWWSGYHGVFLFKQVTGDFAVSARLKVTGKEGGEPANIWTISGLLVRSAANTNIPREQRKENWIYLMTGRGPVESRVVDAKSTRDGINAWDVTPARPGWYELRIARTGPVFILYCRPDGEPWMARKLVLREDLPETLQVGVNVTSDFKLSATMPPAKYNAEVFEGKSNIDAATLVDWVRFSAWPERRQALEAIAGRAVLEVKSADLLRLFE